MSGDEQNQYDDPNLKGLGRYFNSTTIKGRANVAIATYAAVFACFVYAKFLKRKCPECPVTDVKK